NDGKSANEIASIALAPAESPNSPGSANGLRVKACMMAPETANAAPTKTAPISLGKRISCIIVADSVEFFEKRASHISFIVVFEAPSTLDINNITASATHATIIIVVQA